MTQLYTALAHNLYGDDTQKQDSFIAEFAKSYQATKNYGGLERTEQAMLNAVRGCNRSSLELPTNAGNLAGFAIGLIDHQLRVLLRNEDAYKLFAQLMANLRNASRLIGAQAKVRLDRELQRDKQLTQEDKTAIAALNRRVFSRAA